MPNKLAEDQAKITEKLSNPLAVGSVITCTGTPSEDLPRFALNIGCGDPDEWERDMAVHFNVRQPAKHVVRNSQKGYWGPEEITSYRRFPFKAGTPFTIEVVIEEDQSVWSVNGHHYCSYKHREPSPFAATWVQVTGIRDAMLEVHEPEVEWPEDESKYICPNHYAENKAKVTEVLNEPLAVGSVITCTGTPSDDFPWFAVNIGCGDPDKYERDMAVHFNVRQPAKLVVRNSHSGYWGPEEIASYRRFPFRAGTPFTIEVVIEEHQSMWSVNGHHYCSYTHRRPSPFDATWVQMTGIRDAVLKVDRPEVEVDDFEYRSDVESESESESEAEPEADPEVEPEPNVWIDIR